MPESGKENHVCTPHLACDVAAFARKLHSTELDDYLRGASKHNTSDILLINFEKFARSLYFRLTVSVAQW